MAYILNSLTHIHITASKG